MRINFLQVAIAQWEHNNKLKDKFHCTIGLNIDTNELVRMYPVERFTMRKHEVYSVEVEPMTCKRERSYKPIRMHKIDKFSESETTQRLNKIPLTTIEQLNQNRLSMGIVDITDKNISIVTNDNYVNDSQFDLFENTEYSKQESLCEKSYSNKLKKDIRIKYKCLDTKQGYRDLSYNEHHFFVGIDKNGSIPDYYKSNNYNRMIVGNLRNHRNVFIGLCMFKGIEVNSLFSHTYNSNDGDKQEIISSLL